MERGKTPANKILEGDKMNSFGKETKTRSFKDRRIGINCSRILSIFRIEYLRFLRARSMK
jgi:hypothetical protein